jgi:3',5'-cyclic AMP phosphodiesterase CpdA
VGDPDCDPRRACGLREREEVADHGGVAAERAAERIGHRQATDAEDGRVAARAGEGAGGEAAANGAPVLVGAGDIAICGSAGAEGTASLLDRIDGTVFTAGDNAYYQGSEEQFRQCYNPTWGRHKGRTRPAPGNHDYETAGAAAYFAYFGSNAGPSGRGYYSFTVGSWHVISLNSNVPASIGSAQMEWLQQDLAASSARCTAAIWHHPLFSSGVNGPTLIMRDVWRTLRMANADIVITGHDHSYERFGPMDETGRAAPDGLRQFTVGTGGADLTPFRGMSANSEARASVFGVLKLTLRADSYDWEFLAVPPEGFRDSGSGVCH